MTDRNPAAAETVDRPQPGSASRTAFLIGGEWRDATRLPVLEVTDSGTEQVLGTVPLAGAEQVDAAVAAAASAVPSWSSTPGPERARLLRAAAVLLAGRADELAALIAAEVGTPLRMARQLQVGLPVKILESFADLAERAEPSERIGNSVVLKQPVGVVAAITPWNYPLHVALSKVGAALAAGCTVVLKPSEVAPFSLFALAETFVEAGLPPGAFNLIVGLGPDAGAALVTHPLVNMVSFTGSTAVGRTIGASAAGDVKRLALELGGKSASVLLDGADLERAVATTVNNAMLNSGQTCTAWTRLLVPAELQDDAIAAAQAQLERLPLGDPFDPGARLGPLVSDAQRRRVLNHIATGSDEGARVVAGGGAAPDDHPRGYFVRPTVFADVHPAHRIAREEIFGPVLSIMPFHTEAGALEIANSTDYGLAGAVWAGDDQRAIAFATAMRAGQVDVNGGRYNLLAPFGGRGLSGVGRELGHYGYEEFLELKSLQLPA